MESILWDSAEKEEGRFLEGGNPKEWDPWRGSSNVFKRRARQPLLHMLMIIDFIVCLDFVHSPVVQQSCSAA